MIHVAMLWKKREMFMENFSFKCNIAEDHFAFNVAIYFSALSNFSFLNKLFNLYSYDLKHFLFIFSLAIVLFCVHYLILTLLRLTRWLKYIAAVLIILSSLASY